MTQVVQVKVENILSNGIQVRILENNRLGFIPQRELTWDRSIKSSPVQLEINQELKAVLLPQKRRTRYPHLSLRHFTDPWEDADTEYSIGQIVNGEVVNLRRFGAFVQIKPGVVAIIRPSDIPLRKNQLPLHALSIGDQIQGQIIHIDRSEQQMELSLVKWLQELSSNFLERGKIQLELFKPLITNCEPYNVKRVEIERIDTRKSSQIYHSPIPYPQRILVIDDNPNDLERITTALQDEFPVEIDNVKSGNEAETHMLEELPYGLAIIDVRLRGEHGSQVAERILKINPDLPIIFTSSAPFVESELTPIDGQTFPFVIKSEEEIVDQIYKLLDGYLEETKNTDEQIYIGHGDLLQQLEMSILVHRPLVETLEQILYRLRKKTNVSHVMVISVDSINKQAKIVSSAPLLKAKIHKYSLDSLYYSPVRTVVEKEKIFYAKNIRQDRDSRFRYFFQLLSFKVCYGLPLTIPNMRTQYALFLLDEHDQEFSADLRQQFQLAARFLQMALERALLLDFMQRYEERYFAGQLLGSLVHELGALLRGLDGQTARLATLFQNIDKMQNRYHRKKQADKVLDATGKIQRSHGKLGELLDAYSRLAKGSFEAVDVHGIVYKIARQLETTAKEAKTKIQLDLQDDQLLAAAVPSRLEQVLANIMLNAIQQIEEQAINLAEIEREKEDKNFLLQRGLVIVQTQYNQSMDTCQILVIDTGPGIHYDQQEDIFQLGTSTRDTGHGLGLFISRNMTEAMGGHLCLVGSVLFVGSAFLIELPPFNHLEQNNETDSHPSH